MLKSACIPKWTFFWNLITERSLAVTVVGPGYEIYHTDQARVWSTGLRVLSPGAIHDRVIDTQIK